MSSIAIFGAGGHSKVMIDVAELLGIPVAGHVVAANEKVGSLKYPVLGVDSDLKKLGIKRGVIAIGDIHIRRKLTEQILAAVPGFEFVNLIHPSAIIAKSVKIGIGAQILAGVVINPSAVIGNHCIINTRASIDHDTIIENFCVVSPGVTIGGYSKIGTRTTLGLGASVIHNITIGSDSFIGAGSVVVRDLPSGVVAYGVPCRPQRKSKTPDLQV